MAQQASLNLLTPESVSHGAEILLQAAGAAGGFQTVAEIYALDYKISDDPQTVGVMNSRRNGMRPGRILVTGTIKAYFVNEALFTMWLGSNTVTSAGSASIVYASQRTFNRYNIRAALGTLALSGVSWRNITFVNVTLDEDVATWDKDKLSDANIPFRAEDAIYNSA